MSDSDVPEVAEQVGSWRAAQAIWYATPISDRLKVLRCTRHRIAEAAQEFASAITQGRSRTLADSLVAEVLPLLDACRFLERQAEAVLAPRRLGTRGLPLWLSGIRTEVQRVPFGKILVIAPANYPLFLPGVQTVQALIAGNAVVWKSGLGGRGVAELFARALHASGLPEHLLRVTADTIDAAETELHLGADKIIFTGSAATGRMILHRVAATSTPAVMELSGCDAVVALPSADPERLVQALAFGMRLNGSETCMAPRRLMLLGYSPAAKRSLVQKLQAGFEAIPAVRLSWDVHRRLSEAVSSAVALGAIAHGTVEQNQRTLLVTGVTAEMPTASADLFAPLLMVLDVADGNELKTSMEKCPYGLTAAIFGNEEEARALARTLTVGTVLVNDIIVPTADPRVPFGGRRQSGFGVTRGREGLLEMTACKVIAVRTGKTTRHYAATAETHANLFASWITTTHAGTWRTRLHGLKQLLRAARTMANKGRTKEETNDAT